MGKRRNNIVLILSGPGGSGKSTITKLLAKNHKFKIIDGDSLDTEFFPKGDQWLPKNSEKLKKPTIKFLKKQKKFLRRGIMLF